MPRYPRQAGSSARFRARYRAVASRALCRRISVDLHARHSLPPRASVLQIVLASVNSCPCMQWRLCRVDRLGAVAHEDIVPVGLRLEVFRIHTERLPAQVVHVSEAVRNRPAEHHPRSDVRRPHATAIVERSVSPLAGNGGCPHPMPRREHLHLRHEPLLRRIQERLQRGRVRSAPHRLEVSVAVPARFARPLTARHCALQLRRRRTALRSSGASSLTPVLVAEAAPRRFRVDALINRACDRVHKAIVGAPCDTVDSALRTCDQSAETHRVRPAGRSGFGCPVRCYQHLAGLLSSVRVLQHKHGPRHRARERQNAPAPIPRGEGRRGVHMTVRGAQRMGVPAVIGVIGASCASSNDDT